MAFTLALFVPKVALITCSKLSYLVIASVLHAKKKAAVKWTHPLMRITKYHQILPACTVVKGFVILLGTLLTFNSIYFSVSHFGMPVSFKITWKVERNSHEMTMEIITFFKIDFNVASYKTLWTNRYNTKGMQFHLLYKYFSSLILSWIVISQVKWSEKFRNKLWLQTWREMIISLRTDNVTVAIVAAKFL